MDKTQTIKASAQTLGLTHTKISLDEILHTAKENDYSYFDFLGYVLDGEILYRQEKAREKRIKEAGFPYPKYLKDFDLNFCKAINKKQFKQLAELAWIDGNII
jgi:DNA replication protein DnaC